MPVFLDHELDRSTPAMLGIRRVEGVVHASIFLDCIAFRNVVSVYDGASGCSRVAL